MGASAGLRGIFLFPQAGFRDECRRMNFLRRGIKGYDDGARYEGKNNATCDYFLLLPYAPIRDASDRAKIRSCRIYGRTDWSLPVCIFPFCGNISPAECL